MTTETTAQPLPRRSDSGMHSRAINAAAGVLLAAEQQGRHFPIGVAIMLDAVVTLTPEDSGIGSRFEHGLILIWEHHDGHDRDYCQDEGPSWQWARLNEDGSNWLPEPLPVPGFVAPAMLAATVATLAHIGVPALMSSLWHDHLRTPVETAIAAWAADEAGA